jgi:hypothetical protein
MRLKPQLKVWIFYAVLAVCMWLDHVTGNDVRARNFVRAEPVSISAILISLAVSAATSAATFLVQRVLAPKPKGKIVGQQSGTVQFSDSAWGAPKVEIFGARPDPSGSDANDRLGGVLVGVNFFWCNKEGIREHRTQVQSSSQAGKGTPKPPPDTKITYDLDVAGLVGLGPLHALQIRFNEDIVVDRTSVGDSSRSYEGEAAALTGGATVQADTDCHGGQKAHLVPGAGAQWLNVSGAFAGEHDLVIYYKSSSDCTLELFVAGVSLGTLAVPSSDGNLQIYQSTATLAEGATNAVKLVNTSGVAAFDLDRIYVYALDDEGLTGVRDELMPPDEPFDHFMLPDPRVRDLRPRLRHSDVPQPDEDGVLHLPISSDACKSITVYPGTPDQPVDPLIQADVDSEHGAGSTPAFLDDCYIVVEGLGISKYGGLPNVRVCAEHQTLVTLGAIMRARALRYPQLSAGDIDFTSANGVKVRGYFIDQQQGVRKDMGDLGELYNFAFVEDLDGILKSRDLSDQSIAATINETDLGAYAPGEGQPETTDVETQVQDETRGWRSLDLGFFNPLLDFQSDSRAATREATASERAERVDYPVTLAPDEATASVKRMLQKQWAELDPHTIKLQHKHAYLVPADRIRVPLDGALQTVRVEEIQGFAPGLLTMTCVGAGITVIAGHEQEALSARRGVAFPATMVATFLDIPRLHPEALPGVYIAATYRPADGGTYSGGTAYREKGGEPQQMATFGAACTMGRAVTALGDVPGGWTEGDWDDTNTVTYDFFALEPASYSDDEILDGQGVWVFGNEVTAVGVWTRDNTQPNRWVGSHLQRKLKGTEAIGHVVGERGVLMNSAVRFVELERAEQGVPRKWRFQSAGQRFADAAKIDFTWQAVSAPPTAPLSGADTAAPVVTAAPTVRAGSGLWFVLCPYPDSQGADLTDLQIQIRKVSDSTDVYNLTLGVTTMSQFPQTTYDCTARYRWRNSYRGGGSDGWSAWSPTQDANGSTNLTQPPALEGGAAFDNDPHDSRRRPMAGEVELVM